MAEARLRPHLAPCRLVPPSGFNDQTIRMIVRTSLGGRFACISNAFGAMPLMVGAAHIAIRSKDSATSPPRAGLQRQRPSRFLREPR